VTFKPHSLTFMCLPLGFIKYDDTHKMQPLHLS
jgi:hypothetical protein